ncbi:hypothetical protein N7G274_006969 [Stereocaulon virgatum]|uniref:WD40 repeat-like protein n=1 Tax=Stereocaulon virgatum TaxID=373712 RepID=A0ABR4A547_9LECA
MSSFFTTSTSQRKRKREETNAAPSTKRKNMSSKVGAKRTMDVPARGRRDDSISSDGSEDEPRRKIISDEEPTASSESEDEDETGAERRLRLAEQYLQTLKTEVDETGFDAGEIDRDLIAERLQEDVAETKGRLYRRITSTLSFSTAVQTSFRSLSSSVTSIAICPPYVYTVSKDLQLTKWELPSPPRLRLPNPTRKRPPKPVGRRPIKLIAKKGSKRESKDPNGQHHTAPILSIAASSTGKFIATGGADKRLIIWSADTLTPLRVFTQHRDAITSLAFRRGTNQLYSASRDRTIKCWSLDELAYVETLFGHQDQVVDVASLGMERCVSAGARDRTARLWKVVEETQLVFRGGGSSEKRRPGRRKEGDNDLKKSYSEGSIDRVAMIDEEMFVTGSDNGSLSLWSLHKKKPIFTIPLAHGLDLAMKPEEASAEATPDAKVPERQPRWITALATVPYSDLVVSGSWDGEVRVWKVSGDKRRLEGSGVVGRIEKEGGSLDVVDGAQEDGEDVSVMGLINDISVFERGDNEKDGLSIVAAIGTEHRLGRWQKVKGRNGAVVFEVQKIPRTEDPGEGDVQEEMLKNGT